jgi:hypothetical protein
MKQLGLACGPGRTKALAMTLVTSAPGLFYDDEDKILPLLLHPADALGADCECVDCLGIRVRMAQIELNSKALRRDVA